MFSTIASKFSESNMWDVVLEANSKDVEMRKEIEKWQNKGEQNSGGDIDLGLVISLSKQAVAIKELINEQQTAVNKNPELTGNLTSLYVACVAHLEQAYEDALETFEQQKLDPRIQVLSSYDNRDGFIQQLTFYVGTVADIHAVQDLVYSCFDSKKCFKTIERLFGENASRDMVVSKFKEAYETAQRSKEQLEALAETTSPSAEPEGVNEDTLAAGADTTQPANAAPKTFLLA